MSALTPESRAAPHSYSPQRGHGTELALRSDEGVSSVTASSLGTDGSVLLHFGRQSLWSLSEIFAFSSRCDLTSADPPACRVRQVASKPRICPQSVPARAITSEKPSAACRKIASGGVLARLWRERLLATHELARPAIWLRHGPVRALDALWRSPKVGGSAPLGLRLDANATFSQSARRKRRILPFTLRTTEG